MKNNQNGRSMVEMLGVLAIIGVLSAGGLAGYSKAMFKHKLNTTMEQITMLVTNIRTMYGQQGNYAGLATQAVSLGIVPPVMGTSPAALTNPFKGSVQILEAMATSNTISAVNTAITGDAKPTAFVISYKGLPKEACIALATADFGSGAGSGFIGVEIEASTGTNYAKGKVLGADEGKPYPMGGASGTGAVATCTEQATVSWKFY